MRVLSGVQPSGKLHLGNYFGAIKLHIELQHQGMAFYFIADYHALTSVQNAEELRENVRDVAVAYLALGLEPDGAIFFRQSDVPEVTELTWLLSTVTGMGLLERSHSYKEKVARGIKTSVGLFAYPVLMASDILIYQSTVVADISAGPNSQRVLRYRCRLEFEKSGRDWLLRSVVLTPI